MQDLLETNIRRRGDVGGSVKKMGSRIKALERLYGVRQGSANSKGINQYTGEPNKPGDQLKQSDIASIAGLSVDTIQNYKRLTKLIPEG